MIEILSNPEAIETITNLTTALEEKGTQFVEKEVNTLLQDLENVINALKLYKTK